jgi:hypothetical protein
MMDSTKTKMMDSIKQTGEPFLSNQNKNVEKTNEINNITLFLKKYT